MFPDGQEHTAHVTLCTQLPLCHRAGVSASLMDPFATPQMQRARKKRYQVLLAVISQGFEGARGALGIPK